MAPILLTEPVADSDSNASELLDRLVTAVHGELGADRLWLLFVAVTARYPTPDEFHDGIRTFELSGILEATLWLLDCGLSGASSGSSPEREIIVTRDSVLVEVDHSARHDLHTGIQQVVRQIAPPLVPRSRRDPRRLDGPLRVPSNAHAG